MADIKTRETGALSPGGPNVNRPLTNAEVDTNFINLNNAVVSLESSKVDTSAIGTSVQAYDADLSAIAALSGTSGFLKKTAANTWALDSNVTTNVELTGDITGSGSGSIATTLANTAVTAGTYNTSSTNLTPFTVDSKGRITGTGTPFSVSSGSSAWADITGKPNTISGFGITDGVTLTGTETLTNKTLTRPSIDNPLLGSVFTTTTYTITNTSPRQIFINPADNAQRIILPNTSTLNVGAQFVITNQSASQLVSVYNFDNTILWVYVGQRSTITFTCISTANNLLSAWDLKFSYENYTGNDTIIPRVVLQANPVILSPTLHTSPLFLASTTTTQDGVIVTGRAGGSNSYRSTLIPTTLSASRTVTLPDLTGTVILDAGAQNFTSTKTFLASTTTTQDGISITGRAGGSSTRRVFIIPTTLTSSQIFTLPDITGTAIVDAGTQTITGQKTFTSALGLKVRSLNGLSVSYGATTDTFSITPSNQGTAGYINYFDLEPLTGNVVTYFPNASGTVVLNSATQTLTNKTLQSPLFKDSAGADLLLLNSIASAVNEVSIGNATTGNGPYIIAEGTDTNINLDIRGKGTGRVLLDKPTINNGYVEEVYTFTISTSTYTIDLANGSIQFLTLGAATVAITMPTATAGASFMLFVVQDGTGGRAITWPSTGTLIKWPGGVAPSLTSTLNKADKFVFTADGTSWYGSLAGLNY